MVTSAGALGRTARHQEFSRSPPRRGPRSSIADARSTQRVSGHRIDLQEVFMFRLHTSCPKLSSVKRATTETRAARKICALSRPRAPGACAPVSVGMAFAAVLRRWLETTTAREPRAPRSACASEPETAFQSGSGRTRQNGRGPPSIPTNSWRPFASGLSRRGGTRVRFRHGKAACATEREPSHSDFLRIKTPWPTWSATVQRLQHVGRQKG
jgi:hypothetical protein